MATPMDAISMDAISMEGPHQGVPLRQGVPLWRDTMRPVRFYFIDARLLGAADGLAVRARVVDDGGGRVCGEQLSGWRRPGATGCTRRSGRCAPGPPASAPLCTQGARGASWTSS